MKELENSIDYKQDFDYLDELAVEKYFDVNSIDVIIRLSSLLFSSKKPKVTLAALLFSSGMDVGIYLGVENIESEIAKALGESKQNFNRIIQEIRRDFNIKHYNSTPIFPKVKKHKESPHRKLKHEHN